MYKTGKMRMIGCGKYFQMRKSYIEIKLDIYSRYNIKQLAMKLDIIYKRFDNIEAKCGKI